MKSKPIEKSIVSESMRRLLLLTYALSGAAALVYEISWMRELSSMFGSTAYAAGIMLSAFMVGLGVGAILGAWVAGRSSFPLRDAARAELAVAAFSVLTLVGLRYLPDVHFDMIQRMELSGGAFLALQFSVAFIVMVLPTTAMGATYPLVMEAVGRRQELGAWAGRLYSANTVGAIIGATAASFILIPTVGLKGALITAAVLSSAAAALFSGLGVRLSGAPSFVRSFEFAAAPAVLAILLVIPASSGTPLGLGQVYYFRSSAHYDLAASARRILYEDEGVYSRVTVVEDGAGVRTLSNGALDEGNNGEIDRATTTMLALVPTASASERGASLVVGLGTGYTSLAYRQLGFDHVTTVEINPEVVPASELFIGPMPEDDTQWRLVIDDARAHLLTQPETYDAITSEPSWPWSSSVAALFTQEFIEITKTRLNPGGVYCQWLPNYMLEAADVQMMYKTMRQVYPRVDVWAINFPGDPESELLLVGHTTGSGPATEEIEARIDELQEVFAPDNSLVTPDLLSVYSDMEGLERALDDPSIPLNTDDHSMLEYRVFWNFLNRAFESRTE